MMADIGTFMGVGGWKATVLSVGTLALIGFMIWCGGFMVDDRWCRDDDDAIQEHR